MYKSQKHFSGRAVTWIAPDSFNADDLSSFTGEFLGAMLGVRCNEAAEPESKENRIDIGTDSPALMNGWIKAESTSSCFNSCLLYTSYAADEEDDVEDDSRVRL